jgi:RND family efflux transporter MFP subunit
MMNLESSIHTADTLVVRDRSRQRRWLIVGAVVVVLALVAALLMFSRGGSGANSKAEAGKSAGQVPTVSVIVPGQTQTGRVITASGPLGAKRDQPIGIAGQGGRIVKVLVDAGAWVRAGQVLAVVDRSVQAQQAAQLAAQVEAAKANAALAQSNYERAVALQGRGFVSKAEIDSKKAARDAAFAQVRVAQATLNATRAQIGQLNVIAPAAGLILARNVEVGQVVGPGTGALFRLAEGGQMETRAQLSQQDLALMHVGMPAAVTPVGAQTAIAGTVRLVEPVIDPQSRLGAVRITIPYTPAVKPGGFAEARITAGTTTAPMLPQSAVLSDERGNYVYIVNGNNQVERRDIQIGTVNDSGVIIASGLSGTESVVLSAGPFLNPGQKVNPRRQGTR